MPEQINIDHMLGDNPEYDAFVDKFRPKLTTDDCYTPPIIYDAVADWVAGTYGLDRSCFVRPFFPGGDYESYAYPEGCVVVDNPPFSIVTKIIRAYCERGIRFFLFCPALTGLCKGVEDRMATIIATGAQITYANGAVVNTSFVTNLETEYIVRSCPALTERVEAADAAARAATRRATPKYSYPDHVLTLAHINYYSQHGTEYGVRRGEAVRISAMDDQRAVGKACFGGGLLLADRAAADRAAADRAAADRAAAIGWRLSDREREIIAQLG